MSWMCAANGLPGRSFHTLVRPVQRCRRGSDLEIPGQRRRRLEALVPDGGADRPGMAG